jgi:biotin transport system substrate-specific component
MEVQLKLRIIMAKELYLTLTKGFNTLSTPWANTLQVLFGSIFLAIMAQIAIPLPFTPVPMSLQTLAIAILAITLGPKKAPLAVLAYLAQATVGLPVLAAGTVNSLWIIGPLAGYLLGFVASAFVVAKLLSTTKQSSFYKNWLILSLNEITILALGSLWLSYFVGFQNAITMGILPFIPCALIKITIAASSIKPINWLKK